MHNFTIDYIKSDLFRYTGKVSFFIFVKTYLSNPTFRWQVAYRLINYKRLVGRIVGGGLWYMNWNRQRIQIPKKTKIGYGLYIGHNGPVVVNSTAVIGNNVNLSQFTTIGSNEGQAAVIEDNVYIGPNVCIVENVHIGNNVTIGAGSVVTKDIPDNATAVGNYARVINFNNPARYIGNRWE